MKKALNSGVAPAVCAVTSIVIGAFIASWSPTPVITILVSIMFGLQCLSGWLKNRLRIPWLGFVISAALYMTLMAQTLLFPGVPMSVRFPLVALFAIVTVSYVCVAAFWKQLDVQVAQVPGESEPKH